MNALENINEIGGNFLGDLVPRIEARIFENKSSVKTYASYDRATAVAEKEGDDFDKFNNVNIGMKHLIVKLPSSGRYAPVFMLNDYMTRLQNGTYMCFFAGRGFFCI
jgi:hypothetical protein